MKKTFYYIFIIILLVAGVYFVFKDKPATAITYYYGEECPHCKNVQKFIEDNKINEKVSFEKKEVYHNQTNAEQLGIAAQKCGLNTAQIGVPFLYDGSKCYMGEDEVRNFFQGYIE